MTEDQKRAMYNKLTKKEVIEILIDRDSELNALTTMIEAIPKVSTTGVVNWRVEMTGDLQSQTTEQ